MIVKSSLTQSIHGERCTVPVVIDCPYCNARLSLKPTARGKTVQCRDCGQVVAVPSRSRQIQATRPQAQTTKARRRKKQKGLGKAPFAISVGILGIVLLVVSITILLMRDNASDTNHPPDADTATAKSLEGGTAGVESPVDGDLGEGQFPDTVTKPPAWLIEDAPFDVAAYCQTPPAEDNAASLYLQALYEFEPEMAACFPNSQQRKVEISKRKQRFTALYRQWDGRPELVSNATRDEVLEELEPGFQKLVLAQQRPHCMFQTGLTLTAILPHAEACRTVARSAVWRVNQALDQGDIDRALETVKLNFRLARDLSKRGGLVCQLVVISVETLSFEKLIDPILADPRLTRSQAEQLLNILREHDKKRNDLLLEGIQAEYIITRLALYDIQHRIGDFPRSRSVADVLNGFGNFGLNPARIDPVLARMTAGDFAREVEFLNETHRLVERMKRENYETRQQAWKQRREQLRQAKLPLVSLLSSPLETFDEAITQAQTRLNAYQCLVAIWLWHNEFGSYPLEMAMAANASGLMDIPADPYSSARTMSLALVNGRPVVYSIGNDQKDDGGQQDWTMGKQNGDFLFPLAALSK